MAGAWFARQVGRVHPLLFAWASGVALTIRLLAWQVPPAFTDDLYRYRWEGRIQQTGGNPYALRPSETALRPGDERMPGLDIKAVYGPVILVVERLAYAVAGESIAAWRLPAALADLGTIGLLGWWLRRRGEPIIRVVTYAWCPLPVFEFWTNGHNDAWLLLLTAAALLAWRAERFAAAWSLLALAAMTKWWPISLASFWRGRGWRASPAALIPLALAGAWYWVDPTENAQFASGFVGGWRNNDLLYGPLLALTGDVYRAKYAAFALWAVALAGIAWTDWALERKVLTGVAALLALAANVHPWYLCWLLPMLTLEAVPAGWLLVALAPLLHEGVLGWRIAGHWDGVSAGRWLVYGPVLALLILGGFRRFTRNHC